MTTTEPLTRDAIDQFLAQLTDEQRKYVLAQLLPAFMAGLPGLTIVYNERGEFVGDLVPVRKRQPGDRITMTDEERAAMAAVVCKPRAQWDAERAGRKKSEETPP